MRYFILSFVLLLVIVSPLLAQELNSYQAAYAKSFMLEQKSQYKDANQVLAAIYTQYSNDYELNLRLGWLSYLEGSHVNSVRYFKRALSIKTSSIEAMNMIILPYLAQKDWGGAEQYAMMVLRQEPANYYANLRLAWVLYCKQSYKLALDRYAYLNKYYPSDLDVKLGIASCFLALNQPDKALPYYNEILKVSPHHATAIQGYKSAMYMIRKKH